MDTEHALARLADIEADLRRAPSSGYQDLRNELGTVIALTDNSPGGQIAKVRMQLLMRDLVRREDLKRNNEAHL